MGAAVSLELASAFSCLVLAEYTPDMAPDKFTYFYWQAMRYPSLDDAVAHMWAFARGRRTVENIRRRLRHSMRRFADGQWGYKVSACPCPLLPSNHPHCPPPATARALPCNHHAPPSRPPLPDGPRVLFRVRRARQVA
jgi:hypothetical protein